MCFYSQWGGSTPLARFKSLFYYELVHSGRRYSPIVGIFVFDWHLSAKQGGWLLQSAWMFPFVLMYAGVMAIAGVADRRYMYTSSAPWWNAQPTTVVLHLRRVLLSRTSWLRIVFVPRQPAYTIYTRMQCSHVLAVSLVFNLLAVMIFLDKNSCTQEARALVTLLAAFISLICSGCRLLFRWAALSDPRVARSYTALKKSLNATLQRGRVSPYPSTPGGGVASLRSKTAHVRSRLVGSSRSLIAGVESSSAGEGAGLHSRLHEFAHSWPHSRAPPLTRLDCAHSRLVTHLPVPAQMLPCGRAACGSGARSPDGNGTLLSQPSLGGCSLSVFTADDPLVGAAQAGGAGPLPPPQPTAPPQPAAAPPQPAAPPLTPLSQLYLEDRFRQGSSSSPSPSRICSPCLAAHMLRLPLPLPSSPSPRSLQSPQSTRSLQSRLRDLCDLPSARLHSPKGAFGGGLDRCLEFALALSSPRGTDSRLAEGVLREVGLQASRLVIGPDGTQVAAKGSGNQSCRVYCTLERRPLATA